MSGPCRCWSVSPPIPHAGHCCFGDDGHGRRTRIDEYQLGQPAPCGHPRPTATDKRMSTVEILEEFEWILPFTDPESAAARVGTSLGTIKAYYNRTGRIVPKRLKPEPSHGLTALRGSR